uniref:Myb/SANT-like domain-containing protein n=1 Tax=Nelumbo nucifera TaxID=4432 RepID=A0A822ZP92_NELNU|nr:TPA_asm: hypothetical protein HUJ06_003581 [Nelumbo nucifera]
MFIFHVVWLRGSCQSDRRLKIFTSIYTRPSQVYTSFALSSTINKGDRSRQVRWNDAVDKVLIKLLVDQLALGNKIDKGLRTSTYTSVCKEMTARFNIDMRTPHIKSRVRTLKPIYMEAKKLLGTSGFG